MSRKKTFEEFVNESKLVHPNEGYIYDESTYVEYTYTNKNYMPETWW